MHSVIDQGNGVKTHIALQDGALITGTTQDCNPILDNAKALRNEGFHGSSDMRLAARVPLVIVEKYCNDKGITFAEFSQEQHHKVAFLNSSDYKAFRVWEGRL